MDKNSVEDKIFSICDELRIPGLSCAIINNLSTEYINWGSTNNEKNGKVTENTIFEFASLTKPITSLITLKSLNDYNLSIDTKIKDIVSEYTDYPDITIKNILSHTAGFPNWSNDNLKDKSYFIPGARFSYSGFGYTLLGKVLKNITGESSEKLLKKYICSELKLENTSFIYGPDKHERIAIGIEKENIKEKWKPIRPNLAGSLHSTIYDYSRIILEIMKMDSKILDEKMKKMIFQEYIRVNDDFCYKKGWPNSNMILNNEIFWGLGFGIERIDNEVFYWHWGDNSCYQSFVIINKEKKYAIICVTNSDKGNIAWDKIFKNIINLDLRSIQWLKRDKRYRNAL